MYYFPHKIVNETVFFAVNCLHDTGSSINLLSKSFLKITHGHLTPEPQKRTIRTVHGSKLEHYGYLDVQILNNQGRDIFDEVGDKRIYMNLEGNTLGNTGHPPNFMEAFVEKSLQPYFDQKICPLNLVGDNKIPVLFGA